MCCEGAEANIAHHIVTQVQVLQEVMLFQRGHKTRQSSVTQLVPTEVMLAKFIALSPVSSK